MKQASIISALTLAAMALGTVACGAAAAQEGPKVVLQFDTVRGGGPTAQGAPCVLNNQFKHNEAVVWRVRVTDAKTGKELDETGLKSLHVELPDGEKIPMSFKGHPNRGDVTDHFWSGGWIVPENHPTGSFSYTVVATDASGSTTKARPFNVATSQLTVVGN